MGKLGDMSLAVWCVLLSFSALVFFIPYTAARTLEHSIGNDIFCAYENKTYDAGEKFRPDPCTFCHCPRHGGRVLCAVQDCMWEPNCVSRSFSEDGCCGSCEAYGCKHANGKIYHPKEVVSSGPCEECTCPEGGGAVECARAECPEVNCVNPVTKDGDCCAECPDGPNCWLEGKVIPAGIEVKIDNCHKCHCPRHPEQWPQFMRKKGLHAICTLDCRQ